MLAPEFVEDIIEDILEQLPVKSLVRFKSVAKSWCSFISNPQFARKHLNRSSQNPMRILLSTPSRLQSLNTNANIVSNFPSKRKNLCMRMFCSLFGLRKRLICLTMVGSCDGLVCLALATNNGSRVPHDDEYPCLTLDNNKKNNLVVWNPSRREKKKFPNPCTPDVKFISCFGYGFGYDSSSDDYKIVLIYSRNDSLEIINVAIFSLKGNCWRIVGEAPGFGCKVRRATFLNGALHWYVKSAYILAFDLTKEIFFHIPTQCCLYHNGVAAFRGCLCYIPTFYDISPLPEIWLMKEYGHDDSWSELPLVPFGKHEHDEIVYSLDDHSGCLDDSPVRYDEVPRASTVPLCISSSDDGFTFVNHRHECLWFRESGKSIKTIYRFGDSAEFSQAIAYVESLVSPNSPLYNQECSNSDNSVKAEEEQAAAS